MSTQCNMFKLHHDFHPMYIVSFTFYTLSLPKKTASNIGHLSFVKLIVTTAITISTNKPESSHNTFNIKAHAAKTINQILVVPVVSNTYQ